jgi:hypothetical protein
MVLNPTLMSYLANARQDELWREAEQKRLVSQGRHSHPQDHQHFLLMLAYCLLAMGQQLQAYATQGGREP